MSVKRRPGKRRIGILTPLIALAVTVGLVGCQGTPAAEEPTSEAASSPNTSAPAPSPTSTSAPPEQCGAEQLDQLSLRQKLAQLLVVGVTGEADARAIVDAEGIGGIFVGSWTDLSILSSGAVKDISESGDIPLMVSVDQEGGRVSRLSSLGIDTPSAREMAAANTPAQVQELAAGVGRQMADLGITVDYAPVLDVTTQADGEVIGDRAFGSDPDQVTAYARAFADGLRSAGILPVYKHFPGHGSGSGDTHLGGAQTPPLEQLIDHDLAPYRTLLGESQDAAVMMGHLLVPGLTEPETPASLSPNAIGLLRSGEGYGAPPFDGLVFTDDLSGMAAITDQHSIEEAAERALRAGSDIALWLSTDRVSSVLDALESAVEAGRLPAEQVDESVVRVLRSKDVVSC